MSSNTELSLEPLFCTSCNSPNIPVMLKTCSHSFCLGCIQSETLPNKQRAGDSKQRKCAAWLDCPECSAKNAFPVHNARSRVNLTACELMETMDSLNMAIAVNHARFQRGLEREKRCFEQQCLKFSREVSGLQEEAREMREALTICQQAIDNKRMKMPVAGEGHQRGYVHSVPLAEQSSARAEIWHGKGRTKLNSSKRHMNKVPSKAIRKVKRSSVGKVDLNSPGDKGSALGKHRRSGDESGEEIGDDDDDESEEDKSGSSEVEEKTMYDVRWDEMYEQMKAYKEQHGDCFPSQDSKLGVWAKNQRFRYHAPSCKYPRYRKKKLNEIGFEWRRRS